MTVEFISLINVWESSEVHPRPGGAPDAAYIRKYARYLEEGGFDYTLVAYYSAGYDPFTVSATILDYVDLGADLVSIRGYDNLNDAIDYGRFVLPLVRQELAHREATGQRGAVVPQPPITPARNGSEPRKAS